MPRIQIPEKLLPLVQKPRRFKIIIGGRGSGKSHTVANVCLMDAQTKGIKTACFREYQNSIDDSVYALLAGHITELGLEGFRVLNSDIERKGAKCFAFKGLARNPEGIKSAYGFERFWVEEAQTISSRSLKALTPTLRIEGSEIWMTGNPRSSADPFSQRFIVPFQKYLDRDGYYEDDLHLIIVCNYTDNPFFPDVLEQERRYDYEHLSRAEYDHIWLGKFNDTVDRAIIPVEWFDAAIDAHKVLGIKPRGATVAAHDPSDEGDDDKGIAIRRGILFTDIRANDTGDSNDGCDWATEIAIQAGSDLFVWDCDGMGVSLKRQVSESFEGKKCEVRMFKGSMGVDDPDAIYEPDNSIQEPKTNQETFKNKRSQYYWRLRDRFFKTYQAVVKKEYVDPDELISISSEIENIAQLRSEVCRIPLKPNGSGMIQIMPKEEMWKKYQIPSPNMADCMMMAMEIPEPVASHKPINYPKMSIA